MCTTAPGYRPDLCSKVPFRGPAVSGITISMAMTLRLDDQETEALRERAQLEGRSRRGAATHAPESLLSRTITWTCSKLWSGACPTTGTAAGRQPNP